MFSGSSGVPPLLYNGLQSSRGAPRQTASQPAPKPTVTIEQVRAVLSELSRAGKTVQVKELLKKHGGDKLSAVDPAEYPTLLEEAGELNA